MIFFVLLFALVALIFFILKNHIHIKFSTFFKKGFKKIDNKFGVHCYCGKQGVGKTYSAVSFCNDFVQQGYFVITNVLSYSVFLGKKQCLYEPDILKIMMILEESNTINGKPVIIFFDEIFTVIEKSKMPRRILAFLSQMRKRGLIFITTCQEWLELNITLRRYVRYQINCNMWSLPFFKTAFIYNQINDATKMKWDNLENEYICPVIQTNFSKGLREVINSYDTFETIRTNLVA